MRTTCRTLYTGLSCFLVPCVLLIAGGCGAKFQPTEPTLAIHPTSQPTLTEGLLPVTAISAVRTLSPVPVGWTMDRLKHSSQHDHQVWRSPSGATAYGVIAFRNWLLPVASDRMVLDKFLETMKQSEGEAKLLAMHEDTNPPRFRFVAEGGLYRIRAILRRSGTQGWVVYAGTLRDKPVNEAELELAERAREQTTFATPDPAQPQPASLPSPK